MKYFLAVDIGASSGRHIVGWNDGEIHTDEVYRFKNGVTSIDGALCWDIDSIFAEVVNGIKAALAKYSKIE
ncbi:MAG: rhamnulokinase, partial [Acutalibacteraceae bacterium]